MSDKAETIRAQRDREVERVNSGRVMKLPSPFDSSVVGVSFTAFYPRNLYELEQAWLQAEMTDEKLTALLIRNPDNEYDSNAVEVHIPALGEAGMVGHITKSLAARLAPELDNDVRWQAYVTYLKLNESYPDRPGLEITLERIKP